jgi:hypothetical protein
VGVAAANDGFLRLQFYAENQGENQVNPVVRDWFYWAMARNPPDAQNDAIPLQRSLYNDPCVGASGKKPAGTGTNAD